MTARRRTAILISGRGSNMSALIDAAADSAYPAEVVLVLSNRPDAGGLERARQAGITAEVVDQGIHVGKAAFEAALQARLETHSIEFIALAGFMRLLSPAFVARWEGRIINIHPSLLPAFKGLDTHARAIAAGATEHGCTVHVVTAGMDEGPVIGQMRVHVEPGDTPDSLAERVLKAEHQLYPRALSMFVLAQQPLSRKGEGF